MFWPYLKTLLAEFRDDTRGSFMVETVISLPLLFWTICATYEFFEVHRYKSVREKATYTIADMLSREQATINDVYIDNTKALFDTIANDTGDNQLRVTIIRYLEADDEYGVVWSEVRGSGRLNPLDDDDVANDHAKLPVMDDGEQLILVESVSNYQSLFDLVYSSAISIETRVFTSIRFSPQLCFGSCTS